MSKIEKDIYPKNLRLHGNDYPQLKKVLCGSCHGELPLVAPIDLHSRKV